MASPTASLYAFRRLLPLSLAGWLVSSMTLSADLRLETSFTDPDGVFSLHDEANPPAAPYRGKNIANQAGSTAIPVLTMTPHDKGQGAKQSLEIRTEPKISGAPFLRASQQNSAVSPQTYAGVEILPDTEGASLAALSIVKNDRVVLDGAFDLFFRVSQEPEAGDGLQFKIIDTSTKDGLRLVLATNRNNRGLTANVIRGSGLEFDTDLDGKPDASQATTTGFETGAAGPIQSGKIYHAALVFVPEPEGVTAMKVFLKEGLDAIDTSKPTDLIAETKFRLLNPSGAIKSGFSSGKIVLGTFPTRPTAGATFTMDLAAFRIFHPVPAELPALPLDN